MGLFRGLSGRLLVLTVVTVMIVEIVIFVPSVARFRLDYLTERVTRAEIAAMTVLAAPDQMVSPELEAALLQRAGVYNIVIRHEGMRELVLASPTDMPMLATYDLRDAGIAMLIRDALARMAGPSEGMIRVIYKPAGGMDEAIEVTLPAQPLAMAMTDYGLRILRLSLVISLITAGIVFFAMRRAVVRPVAALIANLRAFRENPDDPGRIITPRRTGGELADAEEALAEMQREVHGALKARARLADLGAAVARISHDLRNMLATTQLMADRLEMSRDPIVTRTTPKLVASLDRAIRLCQSTLTFGKAEEAPPEPRAVALRRLAEDAVEGLGLPETDAPVTCSLDIPDCAIAEADPEHLHRILDNLLRNAAEAIRGTGRPGHVSVSVAEDEAGTVTIDIADTGPGLPASALRHLFEPFRGGARAGGTGLGLAIAHDLVTAQRGQLVLVTSTTDGTVFRITLPSGPGRETGLAKRRATG